MINYCMYVINGACLIGLLLAVKPFGDNKLDHFTKNTEIIITFTVTLFFISASVWFPAQISKDSYIKIHLLNIHNDKIRN